jgi:hypothetical protein
MLNGVGDTVGTAAGKVGGTVGSAAEKVGGSVGTVAKRAAVPTLVGTAAAAGLAGGVALGARMLGRGKSGSKVPMPRMRGAKVPMPRMRNGALKSMAHEVQQVGKEMGKTGFRVGIGDVSMEVQKGEHSKDTRDSPLEVLLNGLTSRRAKR